MDLEHAVPNDAIAKLWKDALGGEARWNAIPNGKLPLDNPFVQMAAMAHWAAECTSKRNDTPEEALLEAYKRDWATNVPSSPSARFATYRKDHPDEKCNPRDEAQVTALLNRALGPTMH